MFRFLNPPKKSKGKKDWVIQGEERVSFKRLALIGEKQMCVRAMEWLTDDKGALASFLLWTALPVAKEDSSASESSLSTGKISSDPDIKATESQPSVRVLPEDPQAEVRAAKTQPEVQASQHCSSFPVTLDCTHIHVQHCSPASTSLPLHCPPPPPPLQPPSYAQSLAKSQFCQSETPSDLPAYSSTPVVTQPQRAIWTSVSTGPNTVSTGQSTQVLKRIPSFTSSISSSAASSIPSATHIYSQKLSRPTSAGQGNIIFLHYLFNSKHIHTFVLCFFYVPVIRRSSSSKLKSNSVGTFKELNTLSAQAQSNQQAFISALQKLADKQVARHYASSSNINLLTQHVSSLCFQPP